MYIPKVSKSALLSPAPAVLNHLQPIFSVLLAWGRAPEHHPLDTDHSASMCLLEDPLVTNHHNPSGLLLRDFLVNFFNYNDCKNYIF